MSETEKPNINQTNTQIFLRFLKFGLLAWGGPVAQIAMIRQELVEEEKWISREKFNRALSVYQVLPGPEAHELCVYFGMLAGGRVGAFLAGFAFMLPGFLLMLLLIWFYITIGINSKIFQYVFIGFQVAVIALIFSAVHRIGKHVLVNRTLFGIAAFSFVSTFLNIPFYFVLPVAGLIYILWMRSERMIAVIAGFAFLITSILIISPDAIELKTITESDLQTSATLETSTLLVFFTGLKGGLLTFGGAYTVIPFIQQDAVTNYGWLTNSQFLDGIALSGIIPAPLIIFSTFVGYFGYGWWGAVIITVGIFLPAFSFTMLGHGLMERIIENKSLHNFLDGVTAGVIGIIALTAIQLFRTTIIDLFTLILFAVCMIVLLKIKSKLTAVFVILGAGAVSLSFCNLF